MINSNRSVSVDSACTRLSPVHNNDCMTHCEISESLWVCQAGLGRVCLREGLCVRSADNTLVSSAHMAIRLTYRMLSIILVVYSCALLRCFILALNFNLPLWRHKSFTPRTWPKCFSLIVPALEEDC